MSYSHLSKADPEIYAAIFQEIGRQRSKIELIASEEFCIRGGSGSGRHTADE